MLSRNDRLKRPPMENTDSVTRSQSLSFNEERSQTASYNAAAPKSYFASHRNRKSWELSHIFLPLIKDFELLSDICGVDDISFMYSARHIISGKIVSLKLTDLKISPSYEFLQEVGRTVKNTMMCKHPNILPYFITFEENERLWSVTGPVLGTCKSIINHYFKDGFHELTAANILKEVLKGLIY